MKWLACLCGGFAFIVATILIAPAPSQAAATASIVGVVVSANGGPLEGASVVLITPGGTLKTQSGKDGSFNFSGLRAGTYVLRVSAKLYLSTESPPLTLAAGQALSLQVGLQPVTTTNISTLGHVTVTGHPVLNTSSSSSATVTNAQFLNRGAAQIQYGLEALPGVTLERYNGGAPGNVTTITIRGAGGFGSSNDGSGNTGYEILVLQDGEPLRNGEFGDFDASSLTPAIYSRVEVVKGVGGSSLFGANTIGGTVNLVTRDPAKTEGGEIIVGYGGFGTSDWNFSETNTFGGFGYLIDLHRYGTDGFVPSPYLAVYQPFFGTNVIAHPTQTLNLKSGLAKLRYDFSKSTYAVVDASLESDYRDQLGLIGNPNLDPATGQPIIDPATGLVSFFGFPGDYVWNIQPKYSADLHTALAGGSLILRYYTQYLQRVVDGTNESPQTCCFLTRSVDRLSGELLSWTRDFGNNNITIAVGGNGDNFYFGNNSNSPTFGFETFAQLAPVATGIQIERTYMIRDDYAANPRLDLSLTGYYSDYDTLQVKRFDPRLGAVLKPDSNSVIRASVGTGFAAPRLSDLFNPAPDLFARDALNGPSCPPSSFTFCVAPSGNPALKAETAVGVDIGYQRLFAGDGEVGVDLYRTNLTNHIFDGLFPAPAGLKFDDGSTVVDISKSVNIAHAVYQGVELEGTAPFTKNFNAHLAYDIQTAYPTGVDALTQQALGDVVNNQQFLGVPIHKYGWTINYSNPARATAFFGADYYAQNNAYNQPPFWLYNAGATVPLGVDRLHLAWTNIFNTNAGIWGNFNFGVPLIGAPGYNLGCNQNTSASSGIYCTTGFHPPPHMLMVTFDHRWGSLR